MPINYTPDARRVTRADGLRELAGTARYNPFDAGAAKIVVSAADAQVESPAQAWRRQNSELAGWIDRNAYAGDTTALRCVRQLEQRGTVDEFDTKAVARRIARGFGVDAAKPAATHVDTGALKVSLLRAQGRGEQWPSLSLDTFTFTLAADTARWPGAVYVKDAKSGTYLGRIVDGQFVRMDACSDDQAARVAIAAADPAASAGAYGRLTGKCSCCRRKLTAAESIGRAVGPVCWEKYFG
ncbi:MAG: Ralstonia phage [Pseudomonadota bacterium]|jgi:hypothetical protein